MRQMHASITSAAAAVADADAGALAPMTLAAQPE